VDWESHLLTLHPVKRGGETVTKLKGIIYSVERKEKRKKLKQVDVRDEDEPASKIPVRRGRRLTVIKQ